MFQRIGFILGTPLAVVGLRGKVLYSSLPAAETELFRKRPQKTAIQWIRTESGKFLSIPLKSAETGQDGGGSVMFQIPAGVPLKEEVGLFHQAAEIISHHLNSIERDCLVQSTQNEFSSFLKDYLKNHGSVESLVECALRLGLPFGSAPFQCVLTSFSEAHEPKKEHILRTVRQELQYHPHLKDLSNLHFHFDGAILSIFPAALPPGAGKLADLLSRVFSGIAAESGGSLRIALSHCKMKPESLYQAYRECLDTKETAGRLQIDSYVVEFGSVETAYLFQSVSPEKMQRFVDMTLSPLLDRTADSAQELLRTLELYMENNGQTNEIAKQMFIHRNTAAYRLEKISELLQLDFKNFHHLLKLNLAFMFKRMLEKK